MSSKGYATPLRLEGRPLPLLQRVYLLFCLLAALTLLSLPLPLALNLSLLFGFGLLAVMVWRGRSELGGASVQLVWDAAQCWWWTEAGREYPLQLCGDSFLSTYLCVLNFRAAGSGERRSLILMPSSCGAESYRRLLVRFRITADPLAAES